ncbi:alcohol dehydrogenase [Nocardioidaceae bacterium Broad-1]|nr:alcohol dehydrogenase [Nocardioidaceae bacterium Broad-1]
MYALISRAGDPTPRLEELPAQPLGPDDIRVEVAAAGFTLFDAFVASDHAAIGLPDVIGLGFDFSGVVTAVGEAVSGFAVGDRVAGLHGNPAAGARAHATEGRGARLRRSGRTRRAHARGGRRGSAQRAHRPAGIDFCSAPKRGSSTGAAEASACEYWG